MTALFLAGASPPVAADHVADHNATNHWASSGWFVQLGIGGAVTDDQKFDNNMLGSGEYKPNFGIGGLVEVGRHLDANWRASVSLNWMRGFNGKIDFDDPALANGRVRGHADALTTLFNLNYSFAAFQGLIGPVRPYVGAGIGFTQFDIDAVGGAASRDNTDTAFAGVVRVGLDHMLRPGLTLSSSYAVGYTSETEYPTIFPGVTSTRDGQFDFMMYTSLRIDLDR